MAPSKVPPKASSKAAPKTLGRPAQQLTSPTTNPRDASAELGSPSKVPQYNKQTGRPIRRSAGKAKVIAGYVDSAILQDMDEEGFVQPTSDESSDDADDLPHGRSSKTKRRRKRSPSPPSPQIEPMIYDQDLDDLTDHEIGGALSRRGRQPPVTLRFDVPLGFHGPLFVKLDSTMLQTNEADKAHGMQRFTANKASSTKTKIAEQTGRQYAGFADLPPELRNKIYRLLFIRKDNDFKIPATHYTANPTTPSTANLSQSGQFLRTCKLVHDEGCSVLYGENTFCFDRHEATRGPFWEHEPKEIGYQDLLHFLKMIGPENLQYLRDIKLCFNDARPSDRPRTYSEDRRYLSDEVLLNCLRILRHAKLRKVHLAFMGRRTLYRADTKFLTYLEQIKTDELTKWNFPRGYPLDHKIQYHVWDELTDEMVRKKKLYEKK